MFITTPNNTVSVLQKFLGWFVGKYIGASAGEILEVKSFPYFSKRITIQISGY